MSKTRICRVCEVEKELSDYYKPRPNGSERKECKECHSKYYKNKWKGDNGEYKKARLKAGRKYLLREKYGITLEQYDDMLNSQGGVCAICSSPPKRYHLSVDHCHETGDIRGLICRSCNFGLGYFGDTPESIKAVLDYVCNYKGISDE